MKRSKAVQLLLISASPFYLIACNQQQDYSVKTVQEVKNYADLQSCLNDKQNPLICSKAYNAVKALETKNPLRYDTKEACEKDFDNTYCIIPQTSSTSNSTIYVRSHGFQLASNRQIVVDKQGIEVNPNTDDFTKNIAKQDSQYHVQPLYKPREGRIPQGLTAASEAGSIHGASTSTAHTAGAVATGAAAGYVTHKLVSSNGSGFSFSGSKQPTPTVKRYSSGGAYKSSHYASSSSRNGFSRSSYSSHRSYGG